MKKCKKYPCMKRMIPIAIVFMMIFSAFNIISFVDSAKAWKDIPIPGDGDGDGPVVSNIPDQTIDTDESFAYTNLDNYVEDPDTPDAMISWILSGASDLTVNIDSNRVATVTYPSGWSGSETITFIARDPDSHTDFDSATFTVANNDPVADIDFAIVAVSSSNNQIDVLWNDDDIDGDSLSISSVDSPSPHGSIIEDGSFVYYTPTSGYSGPDSFTYTISDGNGGSDTATVSVMIKPISPVSPLFPDSYPFGEEFEFTSNNDVASAGSSISVCSLTPTCFIVGYGLNMRDNSADPGYAGVRVGLVTENGIEYGPEYTFLSENFFGMDHVRVAALNNDHFILTYPDSSMGSKIIALRGTVAGNTISFSSHGERGEVGPGFGTNTGYTIDVLSSSRFAVAFYEENPSRGSNMEVHIGNIAGDTITFDPDEIDLDDAVGHTLQYRAPVQVAGLDSTHFVISYSYISGDHTYAAARIFEIYEPEPCDPACVKDPACRCRVEEGGSTMGSEYTFAGLGVDNAYVSSVCALDSSHFVVTYNKGWSPFGVLGKSIVGTVADTDISFGSPSGGSLGDSFPLTVTNLDSTQFIAAGPIGYWPYDSDGPGEVNQGTISGTSINPGITYQFRAEETAYVDVSRLDPEHFVVAFKDVTAHGFQGYQIGPGKAMILPASVFDNNPPTANDDSATVDKGDTITQLDGGDSSVLDNDNDPDDGDSLTANWISGPSHGSLTLNPDGSFSYTHDGSETASDSFTYEADDGNGGTGSATVDITINLEADIPEKPTIEGGIQTCYTGVTYDFTSVLDGYNPGAMYYFDWDDGTTIPDPTTWTPISITPLTRSNDWSKAGVYDVKVGVYDPISGPTPVWSLPLPVQVMHKSENPEDG